MIWIYIESSKRKVSMILTRIVYMVDPSLPILAWRVFTHHIAWQSFVIDGPSAKNSICLTLQYIGLQKVQSHKRFILSILRLNNKQHSLRILCAIIEISFCDSFEVSALHQSSFETADYLFRVVFGRLRHCFSGLFFLQVFRPGKQTPAIAATHTHVSSVLKYPVSLKVISELLLETRLRRNKRSIMLANACGKGKLVFEEMKHGHL